MKITKDFTRKDGIRTVTVQLAAGEKLMAFKEDSYYRLGGQLDDVVGGNPNKGEHMKQEDIIRMAQSVIEERGGSRMDDEEDLIAYSLQLAALVAAEENEACAKVCEELGMATNGIYERNHECATAIRTRGNT